VSRDSDHRFLKFDFKQFHEVYLHVEMKETQKIKPNELSLYRFLLTHYWQHATIPAAHFLPASLYIRQMEVLINPAPTDL